MIQAGQDFNFLKQKVKDIGTEQAGAWLIEGINKNEKFVEKLRIKDMYEALQSTVFPKAIGALISKRVIDAYEATPTIGRDLVTIVPSNKKTETIIGFNAADTPELVPEGTPYQDTSIGEKYVTVETAKYGRVISITEETIMFDQTGQILQRCQDIGEKAALYQEKMIVEGVIDKNSNVYKPKGSATAFYSESAPINKFTTSGLSATALASFKDLMNNQVDTNGDPILINQASMILLVPAEKEITAFNLMNSAQVLGSGNNDPNYWKGKYRILSSPFLTDPSDFYLGDFKKDFWWMEIYPLQTLRHDEPSEANWSRDIVAQFKVRFYGGIGAVDNKHCFMGNA